MSKKKHLKKEKTAKVKWPLDQLLIQLRSDAYLDSIIRIPQDRLIDVLKYNVLVQDTADSIHDNPNARTMIEDFFDEIFTSMRAGVIFDYNESVMGVLMACYISAPKLFDELIFPFRTANAAEVGRLSRFAQSLFLQRQQDLKERREFEAEFWSDPCWQQPL